MSARIVVITNGNFFAQVILRELFAARSRDIAGVVITTGQNGKRSGALALLGLLKKCGWRYFCYKASTYAVFMLATLVFRRRIFFVEQLARTKAIPFVKVRDVNSREAERQIREWSPDFILSVSCNQRISNAILSLSKKANLNIHSSVLPAYAGLAPYYWVLVNGEQATGTTAHLMTEEFDAGSLICQANTPIYPDDTVFSLFYRLALMGTGLLTEALSSVEAGYRGQSQDVSKRTYYSWPNANSSAPLRGRFVRATDYGRLLFASDRYRTSQIMGREASPFRSSETAKRREPLALAVVSRRVQDIGRTARQLIGGESYGR